MHRRLPWLAPLLLPVGLLAADLPTEIADAPVHFGLQAEITTPRNDFRDITHRQGQGFGCFFDRDLGEGWSARARFDYVTYRETVPLPQTRLASFVPPDALRLALNQASLGAEVRLRPANLGGIFFLGGLFGTRMEFKTVSQTPPTDPGVLAGPDVIVTAKDKTSFKVGLAVGVGFQVLPSLAVTARYTSLNLGGVTLGTTETGLEFRF